MMHGKKNIKLTICVSEFLNHTMEPLSQWIRPSQKLYHYITQNTDMYCILGSSGMHNER
jgi:hypothetical protein